MNEWMQAWQQTHHWLFSHSEMLRSKRFSITMTAAASVAVGVGHFFGRLLLPDETVRMEGLAMAMMGQDSSVR